MKTLQVQKLAEQALLRVQQHPFIIKGVQQELSKNQILTWIMCAGRESRTFPEILHNMIQWENNTDIVAILKENLDDECGNGDTNHAHFKHYLDLIQNLGLTENDFLSYNEKSGIGLATALAYNVSESENSGLTIGYMLINEGITPLSYDAVKSSIQKHFPDLNTHFFDVHIQVDQHHVAELYKAIENLSSDQLDDVIFGIEIGERGMAVLLDEALGIYNNTSKIPEFNTNLFVE